jgi:hypothetical protein
MAGGDTSRRPPERTPPIRRSDRAVHHPTKSYDYVERREGELIAGQLLLMIGARCVFAPLSPSGERISPPGWPYVHPAVHLRAPVGGRPGGDALVVGAGVGSQPGCVA